MSDVEAELKVLSELILAMLEEMKRTGKNRVLKCIWTIDKV